MASNEEEEYWERQHKKSNRPADTAFKQQRLTAWKPVFTIRSTIPIFMGIGALFLIVGGVLYGSVVSTKEIEVDYTTCESVEYQGTTCDSIVRGHNASIPRRTACTCRLNFTLEKNFGGTVFFYYKLTNFYQNHRRYVRSRNDGQLRGDLASNGDCSPLASRTLNITNAENASVLESRTIAPCGLIANSLFNDTLTLRVASTQAVVNVTGRGIAWKSDHTTKFQNPTGDLAAAFGRYANPPNWPRSAAELDPSDPENNGFLNEDFIVWMRTAALPTFRKLYRKIPQGLNAGQYMLEVNYRFPTHGFDGKKIMVLSTISWLGGRNTFLGIAYLTVGTLSVAVSVAFLVLNGLSSGKWSLRQRDVL
ncbi:cell cycle control protein 50A-like [Sycon ciliatum]|uniref:cell cycle control protein 50A-like n=1 Tax=Sycon ciliatum TaxID=27933 RepID=UPI0020ABB466|eukprot:scpid65358/ scgid12824/ Cell cycle control protein 50A; Transmembrane protein 30A